MPERYPLPADADGQWPMDEPTDLTDAALLGRNLGRFYPGRGPIGERNAPLREWVRGRIERGLWPYGLVATSPYGTTTSVLHSSGGRTEGVNLTMVDYLGLSTHPALKTAAMDAIERFGVHTPSSGPLMGNSTASIALEQRLATLLRTPHVFLAPTGWTAAFAALAGIVRSEDHVVMDALAHQCLQQAAYASTTNVHLARHLDVDHMTEILASIRATDARAGIVVVTEGLFSMDGDTPDFPAMVATAKRYDALTLVDVAHDLGSIGPAGTGALGAHGVLDDIDVITGAFSKAFGTNGGFVAARDPNIHWAQLCFGGSYTYSTALSPVQVAVANCALEIAMGPEGDARREALMRNVHHLRAGAEQRGLTLVGAASPIVPVLIGSEALARLAGRASFRAGLIATCLEFPVVPRNAARYRLSVSPSFTTDQLDHALAIIQTSLAEAAAALAAGRTSASAA